jgi:hypothetical protein
LVFELGIRPDGTAVEVFVNEERVDGQVLPISERATGQTIHVAETIPSPRLDSAFGGT